jgi:hypothetical protein
VVGFTSRSRAEVEIPGKRKPVMRGQHYDDDYDDDNNYNNNNKRATKLSLSLCMESLIHRLLTKFGLLCAQ